MIAWRLDGQLCLLGPKYLLQSIEMKNLVIRADASSEMGTGHVMRCLTLANALRERGAAVFFVCREHDGHLCDLIEEQGFTVSRLPQPKAGYQPEGTPTHAAYLGGSWQEDAELTARAISKLDTKPDWLVVDHYALDERWERALRPSVGNIMVIDDLADRSHDCNVLLDDAYHENLECRYDGLIPDQCDKLLGSSYTLLRKEFADARRMDRRRDGVIRRVLVSLGGSDPANFTLEVIQAIRALNRPSLEIDIVVGTSHPSFADIERVCQAEANFHLHSQSTNMAQLMAAADLAISAGGFTSYELAYMGVPCLLLPISKAQDRLADGIVQHGAAMNLGLAETFPYKQLIEGFHELDRSPIRCLEMSRNGQQLVDGLGVQRVAYVLMDKFSP
jgi:UDP-2,4-diacetamido-2,4,6-trideoxy-beta-L-altropyranose hydrolase